HGQTTSTNFPTVNPFQPANGGGMDVFVAKLNAAGTSVFYSTYLGGSGSEIARTIAVDAEGNAYVTGSAGSADFPTRNPLQPAYGGGLSDAFVAKLNPSGSALVYSTFLGGNNRDQGQGNGLDAAGNVCVAGFTGSTDFPVSNALQATYAGPPGGGAIQGDGWVAKLNNDGSALIYSTYIGGSGEEEITHLGVDPAGNVYVTGQTTSTNFPTVNPMQSTHGGGPADVFVAKISDTPASVDSSFATVRGRKPAATTRTRGGASSRN
ncbi:MAG: SBBP repeat-containing protein, partial [Acidobacteria bacterium]|nr:SBBP repeat-containing protein [Acidobacteriota bacterium]